MFSNFFSNVGQAAKSVYNTVKSTLSSGFSKIGNQVASVYNAVTPSGGNTAYYDANTYKPAPQPTSKSPGGTLYYNNYVPPGGSIPIFSPGPMTSLPSGFQSPQNMTRLPVTISAGKANPTYSGGGSSSFSGGGSGGGFQAYAAPVTSPRTISSASFTGGDGGGGGVSSLSSLSGGGATPLSLSSAPGSANVAGIDNTKIAGLTAGMYKLNNKEIFEPVEEESDTDMDIAKRTKQLWEEVIGKPKDAYSDPEVIQARQQRQQIKEALLAPTSELNAIVAKKNQDLLRMREEGSSRGVTEDVFNRQAAQINYNAAVSALPLQALIASLQGDLELAQDYLTELTQIKTEQIKSQTDYNNRLMEAIQSAVKEKDRRAYEELKEAIKRKSDEQLDLADFQSQIAAQVLKNTGGKIPQSVLTRISESKDKMGAVMAGGQYLAPPNTQMTKLDNGQTVIVDMNTNKVISNLGGAKPVVTSGGYSTAQEKKIDQINSSVANSFNYKAVAAAKGYADGVITSLQQQNGLSDIAAINQFQKVIDEGAVTREQDVKLVQNSQSLANSLKLKVKKLEKGDQLSPQQRTEMANTVKKLYEAKVKSLENDPYIKSQISKAERDDIDLSDTILGELGTFSNGSSGGSLPQEGTTHVYQGVTYKVINGVWTPQ